MKDKPYMGAIKDWEVVPIGEHEIITGTFVDRPGWEPFTKGRTSPIVLLDLNEMTVETKNSRYSLIGR
jgi:hypothetical protein